MTCENCAGAGGFPTFEGADDEGWVEGEAESLTLCDLERRAP
jgi:hypothetical protein